MRAVPLSRYAAFFLLAGGGCALDLATKHWMFSRLGVPRPGCPDPPDWLWTNVVGFQASLNEGALFGIGQGGWVLFAVLSLVALLFILGWLFWAGAARQWVLTLALASVTAGILGNLYDRLGLPGLVWKDTLWKDTVLLHRAGDTMHAVRDWILVMIGRWPWPTFNVADSMLVCGAVVLAWHAFWTKPADLKPQS
ncbi:MAG: signal peptidase II [Thermoguttaceae bacterium]|jgi:signal peptidase II